MNVKRLTAGIITASMLSSMTVMAADELIRECEVKPDFVNSSVTVIGNAPANENITIMVLKDGVTPATVWNNLLSQNTSIQLGENNIPALKADASEVLFYINDEITTNADGEFEHEFGFSKDGVYDVYIYSSDGIKQYQDFTFTDSDKYKSAVDKLNKFITSKDKNGFVTALKNSEMLTELGMTTDFGTDLGKAAEILYDSLDGKTLGYDYDSNTELYKCCAAITALKSGNNVAEYLEFALKTDVKAMEWYDKYITTNTAQKYIVEKIDDAKITSIDELSEKLKAALVLYVVANPDGYENIKEIFEDFPTTTGISSPTEKLKVYSGLAGKNFANISNMKSAYNELLNENSSTSGGGSSGGGSSGGGSSSGGSSGDGIFGMGTGKPVIEKTEANDVTAMNKNIFEDIDNVPWAVDAIVELAVKGVVSGKTQTTFCPNDMITREEFTKLVAQAFAGDIEGADIAFEDVKADRWSYPYIAKAKTAGIINGYSDNLFGATDLISRQDMAVIIYNAGKYKNVEMADSASALRFADDSEIAEYAQEAVYTLKAMGIVNGVSDIDFAPTRNATRAEAAVIIYAMLLK